MRRESGGRGRRGREREDTLAMNSEMEATLNEDSRAEAARSSTVTPRTQQSQALFMLAHGGYVLAVPYYCDDHVIDRCISSR